MKDNYDEIQLILPWKIKNIYYHKNFQKMEPVFAFWF